MRDKETTDWYRQRGICIVCQRERARPGGSLCEACRQKMKDYYYANVDKHREEGREMYRWYRERGICVHCRCVRTDNGRAYCPDCARLMLKRRKDVVDRWRQAGKCVRCGGERDVEDRMTCTACLEKRKEYRKRNRNG